MSEIVSWKILFGPLIVMKDYNAWTLASTDSHFLREETRDCVCSRTVLHTQFALGLSSIFALVSCEHHNVFLLEIVLFLLL
jgi:hypothetical protein